jgi:glycosyltransferase involved in cell wall biosynthesis
MNELVSVIIPTYNRAHTIVRALNSILNQTYHHIEVIIVDDGSTDNTEAVVNNMYDHRINYIKHPSNKGAAAARNTGIQHSRGEYIAFQDSDDEWCPEKLELQMKVFKRSSLETGVVYTGFWWIKENTKTYIPSAKIKKKEGDITKIILEGNFITTQATVISAKCFKKVGMFDEGLPRFQDWELWIRISKYYKFMFIDKPLLNVYYQKSSISSDLNARIKARELILKKHFEIFKKAGRKVLSKQYYSLGNFLYQNGEINRGKKYIIKAGIVYPFNIKRILSIVVLMLNSKIYFKLLSKKTLY